MRIRYLQTLRAVMETGSMTEAASRLLRTQPQISRIIANLENEAGFKLFMRHRRRLIPTAEGLAFYREAERFLSGFDEIGTIVDDIRQQRDPRLRLLAQPFIASSLLPRALAAFTAVQPDFRYALEVRSRADIGRWVASQQFDLGLAALPIHQRGVEEEPFATADVVAVIPRGHPLAVHERIHLSDLVGQPFIALRPFTVLRTVIDEQTRNLGVDLDARCEVSSGEVACKLANEGLGLTLADPIVARSFANDKVAIRDCAPVMSLSYGFLTPTNQAPTHVVSEFSEVARKTALRLDPDRVRAVPN